jgi:hypothetical protein
LLEATLRPYATTTFHFEKRSWDGAAHGFERLSGWLGSIFSLLALPEVVWACTRKQSDGFTKPTPGIITLVAMAAGFGLLAIAMKALPPDGVRRLDGDWGFGGAHGRCPPPRRGDKSAPASERCRDPPWHCWLEARIAGLRRQPRRAALLHSQRSTKHARRADAEAFGAAKIRRRSTCIFG